MPSPSTSSPSSPTDGGAAPWWMSGVVYQVYPRSFGDANDDGVGDLPGVLDRLNHLVELGIDAVWLSPFYTSPMADFGYDVSDYCDVDPVFGTLDDFDALVRAAHDRDLRIVVDFVPNHTSDRHPWFVESAASRESARRDWYVWRDGGGPENPPNNWLASFGGRAWEWHPGTGQWYLHSFLKEQPDLNWRNPAVREAMAEVLRFWLDRGVDGFRVDVAHAVMKDPELRDNPPVEGDWMSEGFFKPVGEYGTQRHVHDRGHPDLHLVYKEWREIVDEYERKDGRPRFILGEIHESNWARWASYFGERPDELHMPYNFALLRVPWTAEAVRSTVEECEASLTGIAHGWPNWVLGNHDEHRVASRVGDTTEGSMEQARIAMLLLLTLRGTPTIYYGDEIAMMDVPIPDDVQQDPWGRVGLGLGRDPERTPMQWDETVNAGFSSAGVRTWLPLAEDAVARNVRAQQRDERSMLAFTAAALRLRRSHSALQIGEYRSVDAGPPGVYVYERQSSDGRFVVALNFSGAARTVAVPGLDGTVVLRTLMDRLGEPVVGGVTLRAHEGVVIAVNSGG